MKKKVFYSNINKKIYKQMLTTICPVTYLKIQFEYTHVNIWLFLTIYYNVHDLTFPKRHFEIQPMLYKMYANILLFPWIAQTFLTIKVKCKLCSLHDFDV